MPDVTSVGEDFPVYTTGPRAQLVVAPLFLPPSTIPAGGSVSSDIIPGDGFTAIAIGVKSSQAGALTVQRYLDLAETFAIGAASTLTLTAGQAATLLVNDGAVYRAFTVNVSNTGATPATLSIAVVQQA